MMNRATNSAPPRGDFQFLPDELTAKCTQLIKAHHGTNSYWNVADLLWHDETRELIEKQANLQLLFRRASTTRQAKKAVEGYVFIITVILSLEVLASDFAGWGTRFPSAKRKARVAMDHYLQTARTRLLDYYLPPRGQQRPELLKSLMPCP